MPRLLAIRHAAVCCAALSALACTPKALSDQGEQVLMTHHEPAGCQRLGEVEGSQGGALSGDMTSRKDLDQGARNDLRNRAARLGADTVQIVRREGITPQTFAGSGEAHAVAYRGIAWRCGHPTARRN